MHVLVTRPEPEASALAAQLRALGHEVTIEPLLRIEPLPFGYDELIGISALVATSRNALRAIADSPVITEARKLPLIAVGPGTTDLARDLGFTDITTGAGTAAGLIPTLIACARNRPGSLLPGSLLHVRGDETAFDLKSALAPHAIDLKEAVIYHTLAADNLSAETQSLLAQGMIDAVILMSPKTGSIFTRLIATAGLRAATEKLVLLCLSPAVAATIEPLAPARVELADRPNLQAMLTTVTRVATLWSGV